MKKIIFIGLVVTFILSSALCAYAIEDIKNNISDELFNGFGNEIKEVLEDFGITSRDYESIYNISVKNVLMYYKDTITEYMSGTVSLCAKILAVIVLGGAISLICDEQKYKDILDILLIPVVIVVLVDEMNLCISSALSLLKLNGNFLLSFVPVYAVSIAVSGSPATAVTYNTVVLGFGEIISAVLNYSFVDIIGCLLSISIGFSVNNTVNFSRFLNAVNRFVTFCLGMLSCVFGAMLSVRSVFSVATDSITSKGIRFAIGSLIPVIGSSISDAYSTLLGSLSVIKSSVALIGMIAVILINFPVAVEIILFNISLNMLSFVSELFNCNGLSNLLKAFAFAVKIIGLLVIFEAFILIVSTAIMLTLRGN